MELSKAIYQALETGDVINLNIVADWIEDNFSGHREADTYCRRLRDWKTVTVQTLIDVIAKFGDRRERRAICRIQRIALKSRKKQHQRPLKYIPKDLYSLQSRKLINHTLGNIVPRVFRVFPGGEMYTVTHKRVVLRNSRHRQAFLYDPIEKNTWWFLGIIRQLLRITHSSG